MLAMLGSCKNVFSPLAAQMEGIEKETERIAMLTKRMLEDSIDGASNEGASNDDRTSF